MKYFVYIILCGNEGLYTGFTTDVERRFKEQAESNAFFSEANQI